MKKAQPKIRITLRMPSDIHEALSLISTKSGYSMNAEIVNRLRDSLTNEDPTVLTTTENLFRRIIKEELKK